ncbi:receptor-like protein EIX2 isoform X2 [Prosopis cineraria]|uniref:receptor-like protein EIX2 isoform X2 n=1 Tax=Prosopis cineraria TaxID=364024 RepID=UPI00240F4947|nr:receptor-like protein EIX2 isoform X2 [Prosopis cineraria]
MSPYTNDVFLLLFLFFHSSQLCLSTKSTPPCHERERQALLKFRSSFFNTSDGPLGSWEGLNCCHWKGVGCDFISGHVIKLDLGRPCSFAFCNYALVAKAVDPSLLELEHLNYLDLSGNYFHSSHIPEFLGSMKQLRYLNLSYSFISGMIPHHVGNLSNLQVLDLSHQGADLSHQWADLYADDMAWVSKLSSLRHIAMTKVSLKKAHNLFQERFQAR